MFSFAQPKKNGWLSICFAADRFDLAHVVREAGARPAVQLLESYRRVGDDSAVLGQLQRQKRLAHYRCTHLLADGEYQMLQVEAPNVPPAELKEAVRWRLKDMIAYPVEAATVDVLDIPGTGQGGGRQRSLFAVAAANDLVASRMGVFQQAKLGLEAIDIPELAQRNVAALFEEENRGLAFFNCDDSGSLLTLTYQGELLAARRIEITALQLEEADEERRRQLYERIGLELQRSLDNFERAYSFVSISKVCLSPCSFAPGLLEYIRDYAYVPAESVDLASVMDFAAVPELRDPALQSRRLVVIGAALRTEVGA